MKTHFVSLVTLFAGFMTLDAAEKQKGSAVADYPFWTSPKRGAVGQFVPGLNAALQLTDAQRERIVTAREEMANEEGVKGARRISKSDPGVTAEQREQARVTMEAAAKRLGEKVAAILTPAQKELIGKINAAYAAAVEETGLVYADKFASVKADEAARRRIQQEKNEDIEEQFLHKLDGILSAGQKEAMARAAEEEEQRRVNATATKKPAKP